MGYTYPMKRTLTILSAFLLGFACHGWVGAQSAEKVTGIGGIFFQSKDPEALKAWYARHLGLAMNEHGHMFHWTTLDKQEGITQWSVMPQGSEYFAPSPSRFMINYRVANLESLVAELRREGVTVVDKMDASEYGRFIHILDADGNKVELWEPPAGSR